MVNVKIRHVPLKYFYYYQWLILGLYILDARDEIELTIEPQKLSEKFFLRFYSIYLGLRKYSKWFKKQEKEDYCLEGEIASGTRKIRFCYDIADCPYYFTVDYFNKVDLYFKAQCPIAIEKEGFPLTSEIKIPYNPLVLENQHKIKPSMLGPSCRSNNIYSYRILRKGLESIMTKAEAKTGKLMCYFGNAKGPKPTYAENPDLYNKETDILGRFGDIITHPNEKRASASRIISEMGNGYDGRIINDGHFGSDGKPSNIHLFIPLEDYGLHISRFYYNLNISGNRLSIPNRFIYSFAVGTAVLTDKLHVKWYKPFGKEVVETTEMGYLRNDHIDWDAFIQSVKTLPDILPCDVLKEFNDKWVPDVFAQYIINTSLELLKNK